MNETPLQTILAELEKCQFKVSTDTRKDLNGSIYFALFGENFDGNNFVFEALQKGAVGAVTDNPKNIGEKIYLVGNVLKTLQTVAGKYREQFNIPVIALGGSNGKTTSKELVRDVLKTTYTVHSTEGSLNNHIGVPLSILSMNKNTEIGIFEIGANHPQEHIELLDILKPTHTIVTNNGMDHLEGFVTPEDARKANKEIYDWTLIHQAQSFVNKNLPDLMEDSKHTERIVYPTNDLVLTGSYPLSFMCDGKKYLTHLFGNYNLENIQLAVCIGQYFGVTPEVALNAVCEYLPLSKRSQLVLKNNMTFIVDCYNANPTSMQLALESFVTSAPSPRGVVLGDMLELGSYSLSEHRKIVEYIENQTLDCVIYIGEHFKKALENKTSAFQWFADSDEAQKWFATQKLDGYTFLLKGSRGMAVEKVLK